MPIAVMGENNDWYTGVVKKKETGVVYVEYRSKDHTWNEWIATTSERLARINSKQTMPANAPPAPVKVARRSILRQHVLRIMRLAGLKFTTVSRKSGVHRAPLQAMMDGESLSPREYKMLVGWLHKRYAKLGIQFNYKDSVI